MERVMSVEEWPEDWPEPESLKYVEESWPAGGVRVYYRPSKYAPEHVIDFVVAEVTGRHVDDGSAAGIEVLFIGFRKWDGCTQLRGTSENYFLHYDDSQDMARVLTAMHKLIWSEALDPDQVDVDLTRG